MTAKEKKIVLDRLVSADRILSASRLVDDSTAVKRYAAVYSALLSLTLDLGITHDEIINAAIKGVSE